MTTRRRGTRAVLALVTIGALTLAGCGGDDDTSTKKSDLEVVVNPDDSTNNEGVAVPERRFFAADSPWNTRIDGAGVDDRSSQMIGLARERVGVVQRNGTEELVRQRRIVNEGVYINTERWTTAVVAGGEPTKLVCRQIVCGDGADTTTLSIPSDVDPDPRFDGWFTVFDVSKPIAYDLWRARREDDGTISYNFMRKWDLDGSGFQAPQTVSARGSGLPLFAGLIRPKELEAGLINHALAISVPGPAQSVFVEPASSTDGNGRVNSLRELNPTVRIISEGVGPHDGFTGYAAFVGDPPRTRWGDYGAVAMDGDTLWLASESIEQSCTLDEYLDLANFPDTVGSCGDTRTALANWSTRVSSLNI